MGAGAKDLDAPRARRGAARLGEAFCVQFTPLTGPDSRSSGSRASLSRGHAAPRRLSALALPKGLDNTRFGVAAAAAAADRRTRKWFDGFFFKFPPFSHQQASGSRNAQRDAAVAIR